jgi:excisionase family DNA binding protein
MLGHENPEQCLGTQEDRMTTAAADAGPLLYRVREAALKLTISESKMWELLARGEVESIKIDGSRRITPAALEAYIARQADAGAT